MSEHRPFADILRDYSEAAMAYGAYAGRESEEVVLNLNADMKFYERELIAYVEHLEKKS